MFNLFFGNLWSTLSTLTLLAVLAYILLYSLRSITAVKQRDIINWGRRILFLTLIGLLLCIFAVIRDDYAMSVQGFMNGTEESGLFAIDSIQVYLAYFGGAVIGFSSLTSIFIRNQKYRKIMFFVLSGAILFKICIIEISRIIKM